MKRLRHAISASVIIVALAASGQLYDTARLLPKHTSANKYFAFTISSTNTVSGIDFSITVNPKTSGFFFNADLACYDGKGQITRDSLEYPEYPQARGEPHEYRFGVASNLLAHSQFILRYSQQERYLKEKAVDSIWFFLRDFAPAATEYAQPFPVVGIPRSATAQQRAAAEKVGREFGITVSTLDTNPVCCVWLELRSWRPNPGTDGYVIIHQAGGTLITASSQQQLDSAVDRFIKSSRQREGKRECPVGLMTSYDILK
jgi:hypothetical protein